MSSFAVTVHRIHLEEHPNADALMIGSIPGMDYQFVVGKHYEEGQLGFYIPEGAIVPDKLIEEMELTGKLAGGAKNRVKAIKLRGTLSQGLWYGPMGASWNPAWIEGDDVADVLGITKYEPPVPQQLQGIAKPRPVGPLRDFWHAYDVENIKNFPDIFVAGDEIVITEKLHGTLLFAGIIEGEEVVTSKGLSHRNLVIEENADNLYWRVAREYGLFEKLRALFGGDNAIIFGEIVGVQDLKYGLGGGKTSFHAFDIYVAGGFLSSPLLQIICRDFDIPLVPTLYEGGYSRAVVDEHTTGVSTLASHIREGVVIRSRYERRDDRVGRVILKSVSPDYLTRKGDVTEFA